MLARTSTALVKRSVMHVAKRQLHVDQAGQPFKNMPFGRGSPLTFTLGISLFFSSGFCIPFLMARYTMMNK
ncbi:hypothetical protein SNEBB_004593 [Seison nebaliae]|nr:hypothetical protein SNEBB_004593 [Seison nebaliae]